MDSSTTDEHIIGSERQDLEYVEAVLEGRVTTFGRYGGERPSTNHARRRGRGGEERGRRSRGRGDRHHSRRRDNRRGRQRAGLERAPVVARTHESIDAFLGTEAEVADGRDPILDTADFLAFQTIVKTQSLMMYGDGMVYRRCLDVFRPMNLAQGMRQCYERLTQRMQMDSFLDISNSAEIASLSWLLLTHDTPSHMCFPLEGEESSVGDFGAWMVSVALFLQSLKECKGSDIRTIDILVRCDCVPDRATDVVLQGLEHISMMVKQLSAAHDKVLHISFILHGLILMDDSSRFKQGLETFQRELLEAFWQYQSNLLGPEQKVAFLMGLHYRLGKKSPLYTLNRDMVENIFTLLEKERVYVDFPDPVYSDSEDVIAHEMSA